MKRIIMKSKRRYTLKHLSTHKTQRFTLKIVCVCVFVSLMRSTYLIQHEVSRIKETKKATNATIEKNENFQMGEYPISSYNP